MSLTPGTRLGSYEILSHIGTGGMGEVYRATDTRLRREVTARDKIEGIVADASTLSPSAVLALVTEARPT